MSYIHFDKTLMTNLEEALPKEILRSNRSGAYSCSTIVDCNTRKYHGLLVVPIPELGDENYVLLSSLDETVVQHGAEFNLGLHKYQRRYVYLISGRGSKVLCRSAGTMGICLGWIYGDGCGIDHSKYRFSERTSFFKKRKCAG